MSSPLHPVARLPEQWRAVLVARGEPQYRADQIFRWIHAKGELSTERMTNLPVALRRALRAEGLRAPLQLEATHVAADGAAKLVLRLTDGACVETVLLPQSAPGAQDDADQGAVENGPGDAATATAGPAGESPAPNRPARERVTQCISTQVGCAMGCALCASGQAGLRRHLGPEEIVGQVLVGRSTLRPDQTLGNVLLMGMGEPLHNYEATACALRLLSHPDGLALARRRLTVSTCGLVPGIDRLAQDFGGHVGLAVSLHGADDPTRSALMPVGRRYPLSALIDALRRYPVAAGRRITVEYTLVAHRNDSLRQARRLTDLLRGLPVKVNLIPMNEIPGSPLGPPPRDRIVAFQQVLTDADYLCFVRRRRGDDVSAACGQLALAAAPLDGNGAPA